MTVAVQKLVWPRVEAAWLQQGASFVAGPVVRMADALSWSTAADVLTAYRLPVEGVPYVDVLRFETTPLMRVSNPAGDDVTSRAGYDMGFLSGVVPVWDLAATSVPAGAELWRIHADGRQELVAPFAGLARGWLGSGVYAFPVSQLGVRGVWRGEEFAASWIDRTTVELVTRSHEEREGFVQTRPNIWARSVAVSECDRVFDVVVTTTWRGVKAQLLESDDVEASMLLSVSREQAAELGAMELEPGLFWHSVPRAEIGDIEAFSYELPSA